MTTVEPLYKGHIGTYSVVPCREAVFISAYNELLDIGRQHSVIVSRGEGKGGEGREGGEGEERGKGRERGNGLLTRRSEFPLVIESKEEQQGSSGLDQSLQNEPRHVEIPLRVR